MEEREIDLLEYLLRELRKWKLILLSAVIGGVLLGCVGYVRDKNRYNAQLSDIELQYGNLDEQIDTLMESMEEDDIEVVNDHMARKNSFISQEEYLENSILMNLDANHIHEANYIVSVDSNDTDVENSSKITDCTESIALRFTSEQFAEIIREKFYPDRDTSYVREVISAYISSYVIAMDDVAPVVKIEIYLPDNADVSTCNGLIEDFINDIPRNQVQGCTVRLISSDEDYISDSSVITKQRDIYNTLDTYRTKTKTEIDTYSDDQKRLVELLEMQEAVDDGENDNISKQEAIDEVSTPGVSLKYILIGVFLGVIIVMGIDFVILAISNKVNTIDDAALVLAVRPMLVFHNGISGVMTDSKKLYNFQYKKYMDTDQQMENFECEIKNLVKADGVNGITMVLTGAPDEQDKEYIDRIKGIARKAGSDITEQVVEFIGDINVSSQLSGDIPIIVYVRQGHTVVKALDDIREMAVKNNRVIAGFVYVDC